MTRFLIAPARWVAQAWYGLLKVVFPARHKVVLLSRQADTPSRDFLMLVEALQYRDPSLEVVLRCRFIRSSLFARVAYVGEILAQMYHLATARACIVDGYIVPVSLLDHRPDMFVIQTWHALGAIKKFGSSHSTCLVAGPPSSRRACACTATTISCCAAARRR